MTALTRSEASAALPGWRYLLGRVHLLVLTDSFAAGVAVVNAVTDLTEDPGRSLAIDVRGTAVHLTLGDPLGGGVSAADVALGRQISAVVSEQGWTCSIARLGRLEVAIDALDIPGVRPFWQAVTGYTEVNGDLDDPLGLGPAIWFQQLDAPRPQRNRIHLDLTLAHDEALTRLNAALAAGGVLVSDTRAPAFWVLADPEGNEVCLCTWQGRD